MLTSFNTHDQEEEDNHHHHHHHHHHLAHYSHHLHHPNPRLGFISSSNHTRQLLVNCAELIQHSDFSAARRLLSILSNSTTPYGDSTDRLAHQFTNALSLRLNHLSLLSPPTASSSDPDALQSSHLSLNQITPFLRFSHLTANQAILEAVDGHNAIHILDFDTAHGFQWPPLMQAIADRSDPNPTSLTITGTGTDIQTLRRTGERLKTFADTLGLNFQFHPVLSPPSSFQLRPGETLAINLVQFLHKLLKPEDNTDLKAFLLTLKSMNPTIITLSETESNHNSPCFLPRFMEAMDHYTAIFESLEATLPPTSKERLVVEQVWFGKEIAEVVGREERHERFEWWEQAMGRTGFRNVPLSAFASAQAKLLLRLHYPSEGYKLQMAKESLFLGWQNRSLFSVSSWR